MDQFDFKPLSDREHEKILEYIKLRIDEADPEKLRQAVFSIGWIEEGDELAEPLMLLVTEGKPEIAHIALEGLSQLESKYCEKPIARHIVDLFKRGDLAFREVRSECIRVLGKVGTRRSVSFLAEIIRNPSLATEEDKEAAVEALVSLAERRVRGISGVLKELHGLVSGVLKQAITCAIKELNLQRWEEQGYLTIEADFKPEDDLLD